MRIVLDDICTNPMCHKHPRRIAIDPLQPLAGLDQSINAADVARPPSHRAKEAGRLRGDLCVKHAVHNT